MDGTGEINEKSPGEILGWRSYAQWDGGRLQLPGLLDGKMTSEDLNKWSKKKTAINNMINRNVVFKRVDDEKNKLKKPEKSARYEVAGVHIFREMMIAVGMEKDYEGLYGPLSLETHALNIAMSMKVKDAEIIPDRIRSPHNGANTFSLTCDFATIRG